MRSTVLGVVFILGGFFNPQSILQLPSYWIIFLVLIFILAVFLDFAYAGIAGTTKTKKKDITGLN
jgi:hypothetical protein